MWRLEKLDSIRWEEYWAKIEGANMLQSIQYGKAKQGKFLSVYNYLIKDESDNPQGVIQLLVREISFVGGIARINRGPLFFENNHGELDRAKVDKTLRAIKDKAITNHWWYVRFAPELKDDGELYDVLIANGMLKIDKASQYGSLLISLNQSEEELFSGLKGKWRNLLRKAMSFDTTLLRMSNENDIEYLISNYIKYQEVKGFTGIPESLLRALAKQKGKDWDFRMLGAYVDNNKEPLAVLVSVRHGDTSTYLIGMSSDDGRRLNLNYLLLWDAIIGAKLSGCRYFDLGGLNADTTKGVAHFKKGTGGVDYKLIGEWHWFIGLGEKIKNLLTRSSDK